MENKTITEKFIDGLRSAATELEELRVQASLGKAEAKDKFNETRKKMNEHLHNAKIHFDNSKEFGEEVAAKAKTVFEEFAAHIKSLEGETSEITKKADEKMHDFVNELEKSMKK